MGTSDARLVIKFGIGLATGGGGTIPLFSMINGAYAKAEPVIAAAGVQLPVANEIIPLLPSWLFFICGMLALGGGIAMSLVKKRRGF